MKQSKGRNARIHDLVTANGAVELRPRKPDELLHFLARSVVGQQLSTTAARTIWGRVDELRERKGGDLAEVFRTNDTRALQRCGMSRNKARTIVGVCRAIDDGDLDGRALLKSSFDEVHERLTALWGVGAWTADMCAMFFCGLPDVYPATDASIRTGIERLCGKRRDPQRVAGHYAPYRTYLCRHIWLGLDSGAIGNGSGGR